MTPTSAPPSVPAKEPAILEVRLNVKSIQETAAERLEYPSVEQQGNKPRQQQKYVATDGFVYAVKEGRTLLYVTLAAYNPILQPELTKILRTFEHKNALPVSSETLSKLEQAAASDQDKPYSERSVAVFDYDQLRLVPHGFAYTALKVDPTKIAEKEYGTARIDADGKPTDINDSELGLLRMLFKDQLEPYTALLRDLNIKEFDIFLLDKETVHRKAKELGTGFAMAGKINAHVRDAKLAEIYCTQCYFIRDDFIKPASAGNGR